MTLTGRGGAATKAAATVTEASGTVSERRGTVAERRGTVTPFGTATERRETVTPVVATPAGAQAGTAAAEDALLRRVLRGAWPALPALAVGSVAICAAGALTVLLAPGISPVSTLLAAVLIGPFAAALASVVQRVAEEGSAGVRDWVASVRRFGAFGIGACLFPALLAALFQVALFAWQRTGSTLLLPSVAVSGAAALTALLGLLAVLHLRSRDPGLRGIALWRTALALVLLRPVGFVATGCLAGLGLWACVGITASLLLLVPGPVALLAAAATGTAIEAHRRR